ncbi:MAG: proline--tRNA ligase [Bdellovibrionales bacterium]|nr:proline--tRNA ligase [Bdellovibrionales bacterium]
MKMTQMIGRQIKDPPRDAQTQSHIFLIRGAYARMTSQGIYSLLPLGFRVCAKIETIIREEMNRIEGQEVLMPVVLPRELWEESGRYQGVDETLLRFKDRNGKDMLLGMTHEEAVVHLARTEANSYKQLPFMLYQIQTKYRDEARPRAGLIRCREFTMKDAYSFHADAESLDAYYDRAHEAYERIFRRVGMRHVVSIQSDTGMMGGTGAHEFMAVADCGEDTIFLSQDGKYQANREVATTGLKFTKSAEQALTKVHTPAKKTIEEVAEFLKVPTSQTGKAVFYVMPDDSKGARPGSQKLVFAVIRGDIEVNEVKLKNHLRTSQLMFANDEQIRAAGSVPGYASPIGIDPAKVRIVFDRSAAESSNLVVGANEADQHYTGFNFPRDLGAAASKVEITDIATAREGDPDPVTGQPLQMKRGIEVGNIFKLGTKYSAAMACTFLDPNGKAKPMIMGCYGIGVGRAMASVMEQASDKYGPIWPMSIAPYQVHVLGLNLNTPEVKAATDHLYKQLLELGVEVLYDDRNEKAGPAFNDADLIGAPLRVVISPKTLAEGNRAEFKTRDGSEKDMKELSGLAEWLAERVRTELKKYA